MKPMALPFLIFGKRKTGLGRLPTTRDARAMVATTSLSRSLVRLVATRQTSKYERAIQLTSRGSANIFPLGWLQRASSLSPRDLLAWRDSLGKGLAPATINRTANSLKAALNLAADHDERIANRRAWEIGLAPLRGAEEARNVILLDAVVRTIISAAYEENAELGLLVEVAAVTGARNSQIARLDSADLQDGRIDPRLMMPRSRKGREKKITRRPVPIPPSLAAKLRDSVSGQQLDAPLLSTPVKRRDPSSKSLRWGRSDHSKLFARAVRAAGLDLNEVTIYALRHSNIVRQLLAGVPVRVVAVNHDTSVVMIERTYSRYIGDHADALARKALLDLGAPAAGMRCRSSQHGEKGLRRRAT